VRCESVLVCNELIDRPRALSMLVRYAEPCDPSIPYQSCMVRPRHALHAHIMSALMGTHFALAFI